MTDQLPGPPRRLASRAVVGVLLAAAFLWWFLRSVDLAAVADRIAEAGAGAAAGAVALSLGSFLVRSWRWRYLVAPLKWVGLGPLAAAVFMGWTITAILPGRLGEVARAVLLARSEGLRASGVFGTVVVERLLDLLVVVLLLATYLGLVRAGSIGPVPAFLPAALRTASIVTLGAVITVAAVVVLGPRLPDDTRAALKRLAGRVAGRPGQLAWTMLESFGVGLHDALRADAGGMGPGRRGLAVAAGTVVLWILICGVHLVLLDAFGVEASIVNVLPLIFLVTLGIAVPVPAALGSYHAAVQFGLVTLLGAPADTAAAYAIVSHAVTFVPQVAIGAVLLARRDLSLSTLIRSEA